MSDTKIQSQKGYAGNLDFYSVIASFNYWGVDAIFVLQIILPFHYSNTNMVTLSNCHKLYSKLEYPTPFS